MKLLVVSGTYNESDNIEEMIDRVLFLRSIQENVSVDYLIVDDNSPDGTAQIVLRKQEEYPQHLHLIQRPGKLGLGSAYLDAFAWGMDHGYHAICQIDADLSHNPSYIPAMLALLHNGKPSERKTGEPDANEYYADFVIGSRYIRGGGANDWRRDRKFLSRCGAFYAQLVMGLEFKDVTGGFNLWRDYVVRDLLAKRIQANGFFFQLECKYYAYNMNYTGTEFPIQFADRQAGYSKMSPKIFLEALWLAHLVTGFLFVKQVVYFACAGMLGTITNITFFYLTTVHWQALPVNISAIFSFLIAASQNYMLNSLWAFNSKGGGAPKLCQMDQVFA